MHHNPKTDPPDILVVLAILAVAALAVSLLWSGSELFTMTNLTGVLK